MVILAPSLETQSKANLRRWHLYLAKCNLVSNSTSVSLLLNNLISILLASRRCRPLSPSNSSSSKDLDRVCHSDSWVRYDLDTNSQVKRSSCLKEHPVNSSLPNQQDRLPVSSAHLELASSSLHT